MEPYELLNALHTAGERKGADFDHSLGGWSSWTVEFENGDWILTVSFEDSETKKVTRLSWVLTPYLRRTQWGVRRTNRSSG